MKRRYCLKIIAKKILKIYLGTILCFAYCMLSFFHINQYNSAVVKTKLNIYATNKTSQYNSPTIINKQYARITRSNIPLYNYPSISNDNILFYPEITYFVELLEPEQASFYRVKYLDVEGYILASDLVFVSGEPQNPYPQNISIKILSYNGLNLRTSPTASNGPFNIIASLPFLENNIKFIGKTYGEEYAPTMGDIWYYCTYLSNQTQRNGYLYSVYCYPLEEIPKNLETLDIVDKPYFPPTDQPVINNNSEVLTSLSQPLQILIICAVCLPCIFIVYMLFKPTKLAVDVGKSKKKKIKRLKKSDYYEFDD